VSTDFWLGLLLSIPLSILANLLNPKLETLWAHHSQHRAKKRLQKLRRDLDAVQRYRDNPQAFTEYLLIIVIKVAYATGSVGVFSLVVDTFIPGSIGLIASRLLSILAGLLIVRVSSQALDTFQRVRNYDDYQKEIEQLTEQTTK